MKTNKKTSKQIKEKEVEAIVDNIMGDIEILQSKFIKEKRRQQRIKTIYNLTGMLIITAILFSLFTTLNLIDSKINNTLNSLENTNNSIQEIKEDNIFKENEEALLACISFLETNNGKDLKNGKHLDNGTWRYGNYALGDTLLQDYLPNTTKVERIAIATDPIQSKELVRKIINNGGIEKWGYTNNPSSTLGKIANGRCANLQADFINNYLNKQYENNNNNKKRFR